MIHWNDALKTGSEEIDRQHRALIDQINRLETLLEQTNPTREQCEFLVQLVSFLEAYTKQHFRFEEDCMESHRCPVHANNKRAHAEFLKYFEQFTENHRRFGFRPDVIRNLHQTISWWIEEHILQVDTQLKPCVKD
jgi:hemerythrin